MVHPRASIEKEPTVKTKPFKHQLQVYDQSKDLKAHAIFWEQGCVDCDTEYLTERGWVRAADYTEGQVMQWVPDVNNFGVSMGQFVEPSAVLAWPCEEMYHVKNHATDQMLSPEHTVPYKPHGRSELRTIPMQMLAKNAIAGASAVLPLTFTNVHWGMGLPVSFSFLRLAVAAKCLGGSLEGNLLKVVVPDHHGLMLDNLGQICRRICNYNNTLKLFELGLLSEELPFFQQFLDRITVDMVMSMNMSEASILAKSLMDLNPRGEESIILAKDALEADALQLLFTFLGWQAPIHIDGKRFHVRVKLPNWTSVGSSDITVVRPSDGMKYCLTVPSGFLVLRREGKVFVSGNTGKTKLSIDIFADSVRQGQVDALLVVAPPGVDRNWITDELPTHLDDDLFAQCDLMLYKSSKASTKWHKDALSRNLNHKGLAVLTMSYDAFMTKNGKNHAWKFLQKRKVFYVLDEAHAIKTPSAKRTKSIVASAKYAKKRRLLTGTPVSSGPFNVYTIMKFLDEDFWKKRLGLNTAAEFRSYFAQWEMRKMWVRGRNGPEERDVPELVKYQNLEELHRIIADSSSRVTKDEVLDLPPKLYSKRYFELSDRQAELYEELRTEFTLQLEHDVIEAPLAIVMMLRLQQITSGYLPTEDGRPYYIEGPNPRLNTLGMDLDENPHPAIVWCRFREDVTQVMAMAEKMGRRPVRYDGLVDVDQCAINKDAFNNGEADLFVGTPSKGGTGITLLPARTVYYYSNSFKLVDRLQSEDRSHRIGQQHSVNIVDIIAPGTIDERIVWALRNNFDLAAQITGDKLKEWL